MIMSADYMDARREGREEGREEGHERTTFSNIRKIMKNLNVTSKQAMTILELSEKEQDHFKALLNNSDNLKMDTAS